MIAVTITFRVANKNSLGYWARACLSSRKKKFHFIAREIDHNNCLWIDW